MALWEQYTEEEFRQLYNQFNSQKELFSFMGYKSVSYAIVKKIKETYSWYDWKNKQEDLTNKQFKELTVLRQATKEEIATIRPSITGRRAWWTVCSCGKELDYPVSTYELQSGHTGSCGHLVYTAKAEDLTGQVFGKLTVIRPEIVKGKKGAYSYCLCECGNYKVIRNNSLITGNTKSCGCMVSAGEEKIAKILNENNISFIRQKTFDDLMGDKNKKLSFDFYVPSLNLLIEYQGEQHYRPNAQWGGNDRYVLQQKYDERKREYCIQKGFLLKEVPYWDYNKIDYGYLIKEDK